MPEEDASGPDSERQPPAAAEDQEAPTTAADEREASATTEQRPRERTGAAGPQRSRQMEHFNRIREDVKRAIAARHTFAIHGRSRLVRECLLARRWCEKLPRKGSPPGPAEQQLGVDSSPSALLAGVGDLSEAHNERLLVSRMLASHSPDLLWSAGADGSGWPAQDNRAAIFNHFARASFTSKLGLCASARQMHWHYEAGVADCLFPRCYNVGQPDQMHAFVEDFRLTSCLSLLKWLLDQAERPGGEEGLRSSAGTVPLRALDFAIGRCADWLASKSHEDIDREPERVWSHQWDQFLGWYYRLVHGQALFAAATAASATATSSSSSGSPSSGGMRRYVAAARQLLRKLAKHWPQLHMDGVLNVWILKPGNKSRGRGIVLMNRLDDILGKLGPNGASGNARPNDTRFVVQKYIERPLLIYETKFDIRQWFIVTNAQPLTLWMYRESYLRFCSQKFSLSDFHESIHLSNNAVQCKYKNSPERSAALPADNMWDVASFKRWLAEERGAPDAWERLIYPGMRQALVGSLLASQEAMDRRKNSFELYGADFMLMDDYSVWLIEINSHPDMSNSTSVTSRLCRKVMEDTIKVVIDHREDPAADTGDFELVYRQRLSSCQAYLGAGLSLQGSRLQAASGPERRAGPIAHRQPPAPRPPALVDLVEELELRLDRELREFARLSQSGSALARQSLPEAVAPDLEAATPAKERLDAQTNTAGLRSVELGLVAAASQRAEQAEGAPRLRASLVNPRSVSSQRSGADQRGSVRPWEPNSAAAANSTKAARPTCSTPPTSNSNKSHNKPRAKDKKLNHPKKRNRLASSQVLLDLSDMYAVGLAVNK